MSETFAAARAIYAIRSAGVNVDFEDVLRWNYRKFVRQGDSVLDIGCHAGWHLETLLSLIGETGTAYAIEPLPSMFEYLSKKYANFRNVNLYNLAVSDADGSAEFVVAKNALQESGLREKQYNVERVELEKIDVNIRKLDTLFPDLNKLAFIKIDVEGAELLALEGSRSLIKRTRPIISVEFGPPGFTAYGKTAGDMISLTKEIGYERADLYGNIFSDDPVEWERVCGWAYWDFLLIPSERVREFLSWYPR